MPQGQAERLDRTVEMVETMEQYFGSCTNHRECEAACPKSISIDFIVFNKVMDPQMSVLTVGNFAGAAQNIAATTLRSVVGDMSLDDVLAKRENMNEVLRVKLDEVTERTLAAFAGLLPGFRSSSSRFVRYEWVVRLGVLDATTDPAGLVAATHPLDVLLPKLPYPVTLFKLPWSPLVSVRFRP